MRPLPFLSLAFLLFASQAGALCLPGMVEIDGKFCIDKFEASLVEVRGADRVPWSPYLVPLASST